MMKLQAHPRERTPDEVAAQETLTRLVRKLRWIGLDDEAKRVQTELCAIPADERASVLSTPFSTD
jgi:hypothetical protein